MSDRSRRQTFQSEVRSRISFMKVSSCIPRSTNTRQRIVSTHLRFLIPRTALMSMHRVKRVTWATDPGVRHFNQRCVLRRIRIRHQTILMSAPFQFGNPKPPRTRAPTVPVRPREPSWADIVMENRPNYKAPTAVADDQAPTGVQHGRKSNPN